MILQKQSCSNQDRIDLARQLGFINYPNELAADPYLDYIESQWPGKHTLEDFVKVFILTVQHFGGLISAVDGNSSRSGCVSFSASSSQSGASVSSNPSTTATYPASSKVDVVKHDSIRAFIDTLCVADSIQYFSDLELGSAARVLEITDTVFLILGVWTVTKSYFVPVRRNGYRRVTLAYCVANDKPIDDGVASAESLPLLLKGSRLLPHQNPAVNGLSDIFSQNGVSKTDSSMLHQNSINTDASSPKLHTNMFHSSIDAVESLVISSRKLNAVKLSALADVRIHWTNNITRHMLLSTHCGRNYLELFSMPCVLQDGENKQLHNMGISREFMQEVLWSYGVLFNPVTSSGLHSFFAKFLGLGRSCLCISCSSWRLRNREIRKLKSSRIFGDGVRLGETTEAKYDPALVDWMEIDSAEWNETIYPILWPRIVALEEHLHLSKPWSFWVLFTDRRDTLNFWTFFFGIMLLFLTIIQVALAAAQVVGAF